jgi:hypothetical protein
MGWTIHACCGTHGRLAQPTYIPNRADYCATLSFSKVSSRPTLAEFELKNELLMNVMRSVVQLNTSLNCINNLATMRLATTRS